MRLLLTQALLVAGLLALFATQVLGDEPPPAPEFAAPPGDVVPPVGPPRPPRPGYWPPGGYEARLGSPYYYFPVVPDPAFRSVARPNPYSAANYEVAGYGVGTIPGYGPGGFDPYTYHFGPGYQRSALYGHYRFPYYTYRAPWYFPGHAVYNRDTNFPW